MPEFMFNMTASPDRSHETWSGILFTIEKSVSAYCNQPCLSERTCFLFESLSNAVLKKRQNGSKPYSHIRRNGRTKYKIAEKAPLNGRSSRSRGVSIK